MQRQLVDGKLPQEQLADVTRLQRSAHTDGVAQRHLINTPTNQLSRNVKGAPRLDRPLIGATPDGRDIRANPHPGITRDGDELLEDLERALDAFVCVLLIMRLACRKE